MLLKNIQFMPQYYNFSVMSSFYLLCEKFLQYLSHKYGTCLRLRAKTGFAPNNPTANLSLGLVVGWLNSFLVNNNANKMDGS